MNHITQAEFQTILESAEAENAERSELGLQPNVLSTKDYEGSLIEYYFDGMLFGFIQDGVHYSNGV